MALDFTHDPLATSWVFSAQAAHCDFPIQNLPFGVFTSRGGADPPRGGVAIGDQVLDLAALGATGLLQRGARSACDAAALDSLNAFMEMGAPAWRDLRHALFRLLRTDADAETQRRVRGCLVPMAEAEMGLPVTVRNYTDFFTSIHHALNTGRLVRPDAPLTPNFKSMPIAYHGRASSVVPSGVSFRRPMGQSRSSGAEAPVFGPCQRLDFELELAFLVGPGTPLGEAVPLARAREHIFGMCLLNDWSARDHQFWEMDPLGPFLGKNFCTTLSPWVVTLDALEPYRMPHQRPTDDPRPLSYLCDTADEQGGGFDIRLQALVQTARHRERGLPGDAVTETSFRHQYWTIGQMLAHHTVNGCNVTSGDVMGTGTISGPTPAEAGAMVELSLSGRRAVALPSTGEERRFLEDGDCVVLRGWCEKPGAARIGFSECRAQVLPALREISS
jgi:fumarylacetoacetase